MKLIIGNKNLSSWSLRPWLLMKHFEIPFEEVLIPLDRPNTTSEILKYSPSAKVPALVLDEADTVIGESLAIAEYLAEKFPEKQMWPKNAVTRALARSVATEMATSFQKLRAHMPHDLKKELHNFDSSPAAADIARIFEIWSTCLRRTKLDSFSHGPFLYGAFSIADAMYAPVVNRFISYGVSVTDPACRAYMTTVRDLPAHRAWIRQALLEDC